MSEFDQQPDPPLTPEQEKLAANLSLEMLDKIDTSILLNVKKVERKVAMIVLLTMNNKEIKALGLPDIFYAGRIKLLVKRGLLHAEGNLDYMRFSEVRLP